MQNWIQKGIFGDCQCGNNNLLLHIGGWSFLYFVMLHPMPLVDNFRNVFDVQLERYLSRFDEIARPGYRTHNNIKLLSR